MHKHVALPKSEPRVYEISDDLLDSHCKTVLLLEDDVDFADLLKSELEVHGYRVTAVSTGVQGVQRILAADFDAIVCDMVMPQLSGDMFYLAVQRARPHLCRRFIFISGHQDDPRIVKFIKDSGCFALWKPFEMREMLDALEAIASENAHAVHARASKHSHKTRHSRNSTAHAHGRKISSTH